MSHLSSRPQLFALYRHGLLALTLCIIMVSGAYSVRAQANLPPLNLVGSAALLEDRLRLTSVEPSQAGAAWLTSKQNVQNGFEATFQFQITSPGADGFAFVIQNHDLAAIGAAGGSLGYGDDTLSGTPGIPNSIAIEFDTWQNIPEDFLSGIGDPNDNHISVQTRGLDQNSADPTSSVGFTTDIPELQDEQIHTAKIVYVPGTLSIYLDDLMTPVLTVSANLAAILDLDDGEAWVGFTAGTGGVAQNHDILLFSFTFTAQTPEEQIRTLKTEVNTLISQDILNKGQGNALTTKLDGALAKLERGDTKAAVNQLQAFVNQVEAFQQSKKVSSAQAQSLIGKATAVINQLRR